jgi:hypothetical protein
MGNKLLALFLVCSAAARADFTIVLVPDMQFLTSDHPSTLTAMFQAIVDNRTTCTPPFCPVSGQWNTVAVLGLGDNTDDAGGAQYNTARSGWDIVKNAGLTFIIPVGNHDCDSKSCAARLVTMFDSKLGPSYFSGLSFFGGGYPAGSNANSYGYLDVDGFHFLLMALEFYPRSATASVPVATWAQGIMAANTAKQTILVTHALLTPIGSPHLILDGDNYGPTFYSLDGANNLNGQEMFDTLIAPNNVIISANGHFFPGNTAHLTLASSGTNNSKAHVIFADYQDDPAVSRLTVLKFRPSISKIEVYQYSPSLGAFDSGNPMYQLDWTPPASPSTGGTVSGVIRVSGGVTVR